MLRNSVDTLLDMSNYELLNEVLSLNAQEWWQHRQAGKHGTVLNEVLSLNAQEFTGFRVGNTWRAVVLNEVLSLNAQE